MEFNGKVLGTCLFKKDEFLPGPSILSLLVMTTSVVPQDDFLIAVWSIQAMNYANVAVFALWTYDSLLRFQQEAMTPSMFAGH